MNRQPKCKYYRGNIEKPKVVLPKIYVLDEDEMFLIMVKERNRKMKAPRYESVVMLQSGE